MVEKSKQTEQLKSLLHFSKVIPKMNKAGNVQTGAMLVELKEFEGVKFIQMTQTKEAFKQTPAKKSWITFDPGNRAYVDAVLEAIEASK